MTVHPENISLLSYSVNSRWGLQSSISFEYFSCGDSENIKGERELEWEASCPPLYEKQLVPDYLLILSSNFLGSFVLCLCSVSPLFPELTYWMHHYGVLQRGYQPVTIKMFLILHTKQARQAVLLFYSGRGGSKMSNIIAPHMPYIIFCKSPW